VSQWLSDSQEKLQELVNRAHEGRRGCANTGLMALHPAIGFNKV
jgi:hypothetical protein